MGWNLRLSRGGRQRTETDRGKQAVGIVAVLTTAFTRKEQRVTD
jgi:hypothetical protein